MGLLPVPLLLGVLILLLETSRTLPQALPHCQDHCGSVSIPYPFGMAQGCYSSLEYMVSCNISETGSLIPYSWGLQITHIAPETSESHVLNGVTWTCLDQTQPFWQNSTVYRTEPFDDNATKLQLPSHFTISQAKNSLFGVGCSTTAAVRDDNSNEPNDPWNFRADRLCTTMCDNSLHDFQLRRRTASCSGLGCCRISIPKALQNLTMKVMVDLYQIETKWYYRRYHRRYPCSYAFIADNDHFVSFPTTSSDDLSSRTRLPMVLNWDIGNSTCNTTSPACSMFSKCIDTTRGAYICRCLPGYSGNPYLLHGCRDIDECKQNPCTVGSTCTNTPGGYLCSQTERRRWVIIVSSISGLVASLLIFVILCRRLRSSGEQDSANPDELDEITGLLEFFDLNTLREATENFSDSNKLGQGGFGTVYKGELPNHQKVAVKRLIKTRHGIEEFRNEVALIARVQHRNLVKLVGYCRSEEEMMLVLEYMPNKCLDSLLFGNSTTSLDWQKRFEIIKGVVRGISYLHHDSRLTIIHRDLKTSNVLLDTDMNPKISDFGIARLIHGDELQIRTRRCAGTLGYIAPEYANSGLYSTKSDVYSFGIMLLEIVSGKKNNSSYWDNTSLVGQAWELWKEDRALELLDSSLEFDNEPDQVRRCIHVGLLCVETKPENRPAMSDVMSMLNDGANLRPLVHPAFAFNMASRNRSASTNNLTITEMEGR